MKRNTANVVLILLSSMGIFYLLSKRPGILPYLLIGMMLTLLYSLPLWRGKFFEKLTQWGFMKTVLLSLTWTYVTLVLPAYPHMIINKQFILLFSARFSFMMMLCSIFDNRDISVDKIHGLRSLATDVSHATLLKIMALLFLVFFGSGLLLRYFTGSERLIWSFIITGIVVGFVYIHSLKKRSYFFYYFVVDGLMLFSAATTYLATII